jgi:hypothetical protein
MKPAALPADPAAQASLQETLAGLELQPPKGDRSSSLAQQLHKKTFQLERNDLGWRTVRFYFDKDGIDFSAQDDSADYALGMGIGSWRFLETAMPGMPPRLGTGGRPPAGTKYKVAASAVWKDDNTLEMTWRFYETPHHETLSCKFDGDKVQISFANPDTPQKRGPLKGQVKA